MFLPPTICEKEETTHS